jgi:3-oxoacyl-[acyl-carrier protein] reductase
VDQPKSRSAVITGASQGIGKAIAIALAQEDINVFLASRSLERLHAIQHEILGVGGKPRCMALDLGDRSSVAQFSDALRESVTQLEILVNCAGLYHRGSVADSSIDTMDRLYETNVRGVCALTKSLLPLLRKASGDIVFICRTLFCDQARFGRVRERPQV